MRLIIKEINGNHHFVESSAISVIEKTESRDNYRFHFTPHLYVITAENKEYYLGQVSQDTPDEMVLKLKSKIFDCVLKGELNMFDFERDKDGRIICKPLV
jgi:hypothetical protein